MMSQFFSNVDKLRTQGLKVNGLARMLVPSFVPHATPEYCNLIPWRRGPYLTARVLVFDPNALLPKYQLS
jgi:RES domain-containing protein